MVLYTLFAVGVEEATQPGVCVGVVGCGGQRGRHIVLVTAKSPCGRAAYAAARWRQVITAAVCCDLAAVLGDDKAALGLPLSDSLKSLTTPARGCRGCKGPGTCGIA